MVLSTLSDFKNIEFCCFFDEKAYLYDIFTSNIIWYDYRTDYFNIIIDNYVYSESINKNMQSITISNHIYHQLMDLFQYIEIKRYCVNIGGKDYIVDDRCKDYLKKYYPNLSEPKSTISLEKMLIILSIKHIYNDHLSVYKEVKKHRILSSEDLNCFELMNEDDNPNFIDAVVNKINILGKEYLNKKEETFLDKIKNS